MGKRLRSERVVGRANKSSAGKQQFPSVGGGVIITEGRGRTIRRPSVRPLTTKKFFADEATMKKKEKERNHSSSDGFGTADDDEIEEAAALEKTATDHRIHFERTI